MFISKLDPRTKKPLRTFPLQRDPETDLAGFKIGYHNCLCGKSEPVYIRTIQAQEIVDTFQLSEDYYMKRRGYLLRGALIKMLGGTVL